MARQRSAFAQPESADEPARDDGGKQSNLERENANLRKRCEELAGQLESFRVPQGAGVRVRMRMARVLGGKHYSRGQCIGEFIPSEGILPEEAEMAIRSHKTSFGDVPSRRKDDEQPDPNKPRE